MLGLVQNKGEQNCEASLTKETAQIFWMQDLMKLKSMHLQIQFAHVITCNVSKTVKTPHLEGLVRYELIQVFQVYYWSVPPPAPLPSLFSTREKCC